MRQFRFSPALPETPAFTRGDAIIVLGHRHDSLRGRSLSLPRSCSYRWAGYFSLASGIAMVRFAFRGTDGGCVLSVPAVQPILRLRRRAQPHRANGAHALAGCAAKRAHSFLPAGGLA